MPGSAAADGVVGEVVAAADTVSPPLRTLLVAAAVAVAGAVAFAVDGRCGAADARGLLLMMRVLGGAVVAFGAVVVAVAVAVVAVVAVVVVGGGAGGAVAVAVDDASAGVPGCAGWNTAVLGAGVVRVFGVPGCVVLATAGAGGSHEGAAQAVYPPLRWRTRPAMPTCPFKRA